ncbi:MAG: 6-carboxytetrahydropterin synthase [Cyclobacteriaceae bacterium]|jgi:6-pyruvoyltetrahydropterin/6-carboxytetrahydropterin synthase|nr:6-carboxytetrahydropterin synthase [Cyclobacteriaceae bacterium]
MISLTKIFRFETAHAILHYQGACKNIHGHSYELHVTVKATQPTEEYLKGLGIILDFKELKTIVQENVVKKLDHKLVLSKEYLATTKNIFSTDELIVFEVEPTAENLLIFARDHIRPNLPDYIQLHSLKLWETRDSYAEWIS